MFKIELSDEQRARADERMAREEVEKLEAEEQRRRQRAVELATNVEMVHPENLLATAEKIYEYVYGRRG